MKDEKGLHEPDVKLTTNSIPMSKESLHNLLQVHLFSLQRANSHSCNTTHTHTQLDTSMMMR